MPQVGCVARRGPDPEHQDMSDTSPTKVYVQAGGGGFALGLVLGAAAGAAAGYFLSKPPQEGDPEWLDSLKERVNDLAAATTEALKDQAEALKEALAAGKAAAEQAQADLQATEVEATVVEPS